MSLFEQFNHLTAARVALLAAVDEVIRKGAYDIEAQAKMGAAVDTGFMRSSVYVELHDISDYAQNWASVPTGEIPLSEIPRAEDAHTAYVAVAASYAIYVELGTSKMAAQPFLRPAFDNVMPTVNAALEKIETRMIALGLPGL